MNDIGYERREYAHGRMRAAAWYRTAPDRATKRFFWRGAYFKNLNYRLAALAEARK